MEDVHLAGAGGGHGAGVAAAGGGPVDLLEDVPGIQHPGVDAGGIEILLADQKDLGRLRPGRVGLDGLDGLEQLLDDPQVAGVVLRPVDLGDERPAPLQVLRGALEGVQRDLVLHVGVAVVAGADVGGAVAQDDVGGRALHLGPDGRLALLGGDVADEGDDVGADGADGEDVDGDDDLRFLGHGPAGHLRPAAGSGA